MAPVRRCCVMRNRGIPARPPVRASTVDLSHHDVDAGVDCDDVRKQMALDHLGDGSEVHERGGADSPSHRFCRAVRYHIVTLLSFWALDRDVGFADRRTRTFHDHLEVMNHGFHLARCLGLWRQDDAWIVDIYGTIGESVSRLL